MQVSLLRRVYVVGDDGYINYFLGILQMEIFDIYFLCFNDVYFSFDMVFQGIIVGDYFFICNIKNVGVKWNFVVFNVIFNFDKQLIKVWMFVLQVLGVMLVVIVGGVFYFGEMNV